MGNTSTIVFSCVVIYVFRLLELWRLGRPLISVVLVTQEMTRLNSVEEFSLHSDIIEQERGKELQSLTKTFQ